MLNSCLVSISLDLLHGGFFDCASTLGYVGPGAGLTMLSALAAVAVVLLFALLAPFLFIVRLVRSLVSGRRSGQNLCREPQCAQAGEER